MARPQGAKSDPIGTIWNRAEADMKYIRDRYAELIKLEKDMRHKKRVARKMGLLGP
jgi:hypothetical protein